MVAALAVRGIISAHIYLFAAGPRKKYPGVGFVLFSRSPA